MQMRSLNLGFLTLILALLSSLLLGSQSMASEKTLNKLIEPVGGFLNLQDFLFFSQTYKYDLDPTKRTLIIFTASYCSVCKVMNPKIE